MKGQILADSRVIAPPDRIGLGQVLQPEDFKVGMVYWMYNKERQGRLTIKITKLPYRDSCGNLVVKGYWYPTKDDHLKEHEFSLGDSGVIPYPNGKWNPVNFTVLDP